VARAAPSWHDMNSLWLGRTKVDLNSLWLGGHDANSFWLGRTDTRLMLKGYCGLADSSTKIYPMTKQKKKKKLLHIFFNWTINWLRRKRQIAGSNVALVFCNDLAH